MDTSICSNPAQLVFHYAFSFWFRFSSGSFACMSCIVLTKYYCNLCSSSQSITYLFLIGSLSYRWFLCSFHFFVLKHILHVIVFRTIYNLMSSLTIDMARIPHRSLYSNLSSNNFKNCRNILFLSFDSRCFNIVICLVIVCTLHSYFLYNYPRFLSSIVLLLCRINNLFIASILKIPYLKTKTASLCCCRVYFFMHVVVTRRYGCNPYLKTIVWKLYVVMCGRLLVNFNNLS